jgi:hypothetical protein
MRRIAALGLGLVAICAPPTAAQPALDAKADEVVEAAFRQQIGFWLREDALSSGTVVCLAVEQAGVSHSVAKSYLLRFRTQENLRRGAECEARPAGAVERATGRPAVLLSIGDVAWIAPDEAWVSVRHFRSRLSTGSQQYRVVRESARWICLGPIMKLSPA